MVNTFVPFADFQLIAKCLDKSRIFKQAVEAYQIIRILEVYEILEQLYNLPYKSGLVSVHLRTLYRQYQASNQRLVRVETGFIILPVDEALQRQSVIKLGFGLHPAVRMWYGYRPALMAYYNTMLTEAENRGVNTEMKYYEVKEYTLPHWWGWHCVHLSHRCSLKRKLPTHYTFTDKLMLLDYDWPVD